MQDGSHQVDYKQVPNAWFADHAVLMWNDKSLNLPRRDEQPHLFGSVRNSDAPKFMHAVKPSKHQAPPTSKGRGTLLVHTVDNGLVATFGAQPSLETGRVKFAISDDTQLPVLFIELSIKAAEATDITMYRILLYGGKSTKAVKFHTAEALKDGAIQLPDASLSAAKEGRLLATTVDFGESRPEDRHRDSVVLVHNTSTDLGTDRWVSDEDMIASIKAGTSSDFDKVVARMFTGKNMSFTLLREFIQELPNIAAWTPQYRCWEYCMNLTRQHGFLWFYSMQPEFDARRPGAQLTAFDGALAPPPVPYWLVNTAQVIVEAGMLRSLRPLEWASIIEDPSTRLRATRLPHPDVGTTLHELSIVREKAYQNRAAEIMFDADKEHNMTLERIGFVGKHAITKGCLTVRAGLADGTQLLNGDKVLPDPGSTLQLSFAFDGIRESLRGRVVDPLDKEPSIDLVVHCTLDNKSPWITEKLRLTNGAKIVGRALVSVLVDYQRIDRVANGFRGCMTANECGPYAYTSAFREMRTDMRFSNHLLYTNGQADQGRGRGRGRGQGCGSQVQGGERGRGRDGPLIDRESQRGQSSGGGWRDDVRGRGI